MSEFEFETILGLVDRKSLISELLANSQQGRLLDASSGDRYKIVLEYDESVNLISQFSR